MFKDAAELEQALTLFVDNVREGAVSEDILYELILKAGLDVNVPVETKKKGGKTYYRLDGGRLIVCLEEDHTGAGRCDAGRKTAAVDYAGPGICGQRPIKDKYGSSIGSGKDRV